MSPSPTRSQPIMFCRCCSGTLSQESFGASWRFTDWCAVCCTAHQCHQTALFHDTPLMISLSIDAFSSKATTSPRNKHLLSYFYLSRNGPASPNQLPLAPWSTRWTHWQWSAGSSWARTIWRPVLPLHEWICAMQHAKQNFGWHFPNVYRLYRLIKGHRYYVFQLK